jgi:hypothetical protein
VRAFFAFVERHGGNVVLTSELARALERDGDDVWQALRAEAIVRDAEPAKTWPCEHIGCARLVVADERSGHLALCTREPVECETLTLGSEQLAQQHVSMDRLLAVARRELRIDGSEPTDRDGGRGARQPVCIGEQGVASPRDVFWMPRAHSAALEPFLAMREHAPRPTLLLLPTLTGLEAHVAVRHAAGAKVEIDALAEALGVRDGRIVALRRLRAAPAPAPEPDTSGAADSSAPACPLVPRARCWEDVRIQALDGETVLVIVGRRKQRLTCFDLGLASKSRKPVRAWEMLLAVCAGEGSFRWKQFRTFGNAKTILWRLRKALCAAFGIADDPFHDFSYEDQWRAKFRAGVGGLDEQGAPDVAWTGEKESAWSVASEAWDGKEIARAKPRPRHD